MSERFEMRFAGSGGQGVILCSIVLAEAAFLAGRQVAQSQSYGPEARGGLCNAELVVDGRAIAYPKVSQANFLLALTQPSLDKYAGSVAPGALILIDDALAAPEGLPATVIKLPILETAARTVKRPLTANIVAVGAINALLGIAPEEVLKEAVMMRIPRGTETINALALSEGIKLGAAAREDMR